MSQVDDGEGAASKEPPFCIVALIYLYAEGDGEYEKMDSHDNWMGVGT